MRFASVLLIALALGLPAAPALAQSERPSGMTGSVQQLSTHVGEMAVEVPAGEIEVSDALRFEPYQQLEEMFTRDDVVYLMRHGPTDWSKLDIKDVGPEDCANQRVMIEEGEARMRDLGTLLAANDILPSRIVTSQWCRNRQTVDNLLTGIARVDPDEAEAMPVEIDPELNLLLSLQGAKNTSDLRSRISAWDGDPDRSGPLLIVSHYTNIEELTQFRVFEGEILVLDPDRDNQVLGYVRLKSAAPDVGHFADALTSPLLDEEQAFDMVERYYQALNSVDADMLSSVLSDEWIVHGESPSLPERNADQFLEFLMTTSEGLGNARFVVEDVFLAEDVVTVRGIVHGVHSGTILGVPPTGREVAFGTMAVHRVDNGEIVETWQMADRATLLQLITRPD